MNEKLAGGIKSKTMWLNGGGIMALAALWNDPTIAVLPDEIKYGLLALCGLNMLLRAVTNESLEKKGAPKKTLPLSEEEKQDLVKRVSKMTASTSAEQLEYLLSTQAGKGLVVKIIREVMESETPPKETIVS